MINVEFKIVYPNERYIDIKQIIIWGEDCADNHDLDFEEYVEIKGLRLYAAVSLLVDYGEVTFAYNKDTGCPINRSKMH